MASRATTTVPDSGHAALWVVEGSEGTFNEVSYGARSVLADQTPRTVTGLGTQAVVFASTVTGLDMPQGVAIAEYPTYVVAVTLVTTGSVDDHAAKAEALLRAAIDALG